MLITIFTPTYNRAYTLPNLYKSLLKQTLSDFEWLIIDDGSIDETSQLISGYIEENKIQIRYVKVLNSGKHIAINKGVELAKGDLFFIVDSDDELPKTSIENILSQYETIKFDEKIAGVVGRKGFRNNLVVGNDGNYSNLITDVISFRYFYRIKGDMAEVIKTNVLKRYIFPEFINEKFCPESLIWNRIAQSYDLLWFNKIVYYCEYLPDGLTNNIVKIRMKSVNASMLYYSELAGYKIPLLDKLKATTNYWRFSFNSNYMIFQNLKKVSYFESIICLPLGYVMYLKDISRK